MRSRCCVIPVPDPDAPVLVVVMDSVVLDLSPPYTIRDDPVDDVGRGIPPALLAENDPLLLPPTIELRDESMVKDFSNCPRPSSIPALRMCGDSGVAMLPTRGACRARTSGASSRWTVRGGDGDKAPGDPLPSARCDGLRLCFRRPKYPNSSSAPGDSAAIVAYVGLEKGGAEWGGSGLNGSSTPCALVSGTALDRAAAAAAKFELVLVDTRIVGNTSGLSAPLSTLLAPARKARLLRRG